MMNTNPIRYQGLDALRAFAMMMGVVLHASMFYVEGIGAELGYELTGRIMIPISETLGILFFFIHTWRMPVFFLLAGFFARLMIQKRGIASLLKNRLIRIVIPLITGTLVYSSVFRFGTLRELHHLWFLYDLIWMYLFLVGMKYLRKLWPGDLTRIDWVFSSPAKLWWLMIPLLPATVIGRPAFFNWINADVGLPGPFFILAFLYLLIGWFMQRNTHILTALAQEWKTHFLLGIVSFGALVLILGSLEGNELFWLLGLIVSSVSTFAIIMGFIGGAQAMFQKSNRLISYLVGASYWVYLLHLVVVFSIGGEILKNTSLHPLFAVSINIVATTCICIATYHIFVRYTAIGWVLHGRKGQFTDVFKVFARNDRTECHQEPTCALLSKWPRL